MLVAQIEPPNRFNQGDQVLRTHQPCLALAEAREDVHVVAGTWLCPLMQEVAGHADVLVLAQAVWPDFLPLIGRRRAAGRATVVEVNDNFTALQPFNPVSGYWQAPCHRALLMQLAAQGDGLQLSSAELERRFGWLHPRRTVLPNQLMEVPPWRAADWAQPRPLVVGWAGSGGHRDDLAQLAEVLRRVHDATDNVVFRVMAQPDMLKGFAAWPTGRLQLTQPGSYRAYLSFLAGLHVGLAPLAPTPFNDCRSDVKFVEYAAHSVAALVSDRPAYAASVRHGDNGLKAGTIADFEGQLLALARRPERARKLAYAAWREVSIRRLQRHQAPRHLAFIQGAPSGRGSARPAAAAEADRTWLRAAFRRLPTVALRPHPRFWQLQEDEDGRDILAALTPGDNDRPAAEPVRTMAEVARRAPGAYLPALILGRMHPDVKVWRPMLRRAQELLRWGCDAPYTAASRAFVRGDLSSAERDFSAASERAPMWPLPHEALARIALDRGERPLALVRLWRALAASAYYRPPAVALARLLHQEPHGEQATRLLAGSMPAALAAPDEGLARAALWAERGRWDAAAEEMEAVLAADPDHLGVLRPHLAHAYLKGGRLAAARPLLRGQGRRARPADGPPGRATTAPSARAPP